MLVVEPPVAHSASTPDWRQRLHADRAALKAEFLQRGDPARLLKRLTRLTDDVLRSVWRESAMPPSSALLAAGGYGREQLFPFSDIDVVILLPDAEDERLGATIERLVTTLWDIGLDIGHSVRTIADCLRESAADLTVQTNLLEARWIAGGQALYGQFEQALRAQIDAAKFFDAKLTEQRRRHARHHETAYNLEPNIKESPGGLRDLHTVLWLANAAGVGKDFAALASAGIISREEARRIRRDERVLNELRVRLHYAANRREDRLLFDFQTELAAQLGLAGGDNRQRSRAASEALMRRYYRTVKDVSLFCSVVLQNLRVRVHPELNLPAIVLNERFAGRGDLLEVRDEAVFERAPASILEAFHLLQTNPAFTGVEAMTQRALWRARGKIDATFRAAPHNRARFMEILRDPRRVTFALRLMNQYGVLGRYLPVFGRIVGQMQHDGFHVYTVDEHILKVLRNLRRFAISAFDAEYPFCSGLMQSFYRAETLYIAALFHDIAKGRGGDHSTLGSRDAQRFCEQHGVSADDTALIVWLVEQHLVMSATAQKQDLGDPEVIAKFARTVRTERRLIALYLLTVADIRGTSPKVWNAWKGKLLEDLFRLTRRHLLGATGSIEVELLRKKEEALRIVRGYALSEGVHEKLWAELDTSYFQRHDAQQIAWHTRLLRGRESAREPVVRARLSPVGEGVQVMIYCADHPGLFARICGFFSALNYDIVDAKIFTTRHGYALDTFQIFDRVKKPVHYRDFLNYIEYELKAALSQRSALKAPVKARLSRQLKHFPIQPEVAIEADEQSDCYVLSFSAGDRPGLLYSVALTFLEHRLNLLSAKVSTLGERAEDTFVVSGGSLNDPEEREALRRELIAQLTNE